MARQQKMPQTPFTKVAKNATGIGMSAKTEFSDYRKSRGLSLAEVARKFGVDRTTILRWEKGKPPVPIKRIGEIEALTGISRNRLRPDVFKVPSSEAAE
jgi:transcriptional regulator with XRE-family HTH domain